MSSEFVLSPNSLVITALDLPAAKGKSGYCRGYFLSTGGEILNGEKPLIRPVTRKTLLKPPHLELFKALQSGDKVCLIVYPTRTYSAGFGGTLFSAFAPEDLALRRWLRMEFKDQFSDHRIPISLTHLFENIPGYLNSGEKDRHKAETAQVDTSEEGRINGHSKSWIQFDCKYLKNILLIFKNAMTRPNRQDLFYLVTKSLGLNLIINLIFATSAFFRGELPLLRAIASLCWYRLQDIVFTIFGQTYMKFLGGMTGMLRIRSVFLGDFLLVYIQFSCLEFLNRLILGPLGENPLVYTWEGVLLILRNNLQGLVSGGLFVPAVNKMRRAGVISHSTMMHMYQLGSLAFHFGLFASFGYQTIFNVITTVWLIFGWGAYAIFSLPIFKTTWASVLDQPVTIRKLDSLAESFYRHSK